LKVYPGDIDAVADAAPKVNDVCTFAVEDSLYGQNVGIALVIEGNPDNVMPDVRAQMSERLAQHQMPVCWYVVDEIPRTSRGKINRAAVAETCLALPRFRFPAN
jgi:acyl-CoA synthetase (AMP-forming)/AMP-acid ligase II